MKLRRNMKDCSDAEQQRKSGIMGIAREKKGEGIEGDERVQQQELI